MLEGVSCDSDSCTRLVEELFVPFAHLTHSGVKCNTLSLFLEISFDVLQMCCKGR